MIDDLMRFVGLEPESDRLRRDLARTQNEWGRNSLEILQAVHKVRAKLDAQQAEINRLRGLLSIALGEMERADREILNECGVGAVNINLMNELRRELGGNDAEC